jgi:hypothetical protein
MRVVRSERLARLATGALLVQAAVAPRPARAGCNHLVTSQLERSLTINQLDLLVVGNSFARSRADLDHSLPAPAGRKPCAGPSCSSRIPVPSSSVTSGTSGFDQCCIVSVAAYLVALDPTAGAFNEPTSRAGGQATSIFHPPRA